MDVKVVARLDFWDYVSLCTLVILSTLVGFYQAYIARNSEQTKEFLVANKKIGIIPLILSTVATFFSAVSALVVPVEIYNHGLSFSLVSVTVIIITFTGAFVFLPVYFKLNKDTTFEYLEMRFCKSVRIFTSFLMFLTMLLHSACVLYAPALALNHVTGLDIWTSVLSIGVACIFYTSFGGIKAVVWADVTQCLAMIGVFLLIIIKGSINLGGFDTVWERARAGNRSTFFIWTSSPYSQYSAWTMLIGYSLYLMPVLVFNQALVQRYMSNSTLKRAQISFIGGNIGIALGYVIFSLSAIMIYATYHDCDPLLDGKIVLKDQLFVLYAVETLSFCKGLVGLFVACIMCATLSTLSSNLNSMTVLTLSDYLPMFKQNISETTALKLSKILVIVYGVLSVVLVTLPQHVGGIMKTMFTFNTLCGGPTLVVFIAGMMLPWINAKGIIAGMLSSVVLPLWAIIGNIITSPRVPHAPLSTAGCVNSTVTYDNYYSDNDEKSFLEGFYSTHPLWFTSWSLVSGILVALIVSFITGFQKLNELNLDLLIPTIKKLITIKSKTHHGIVDEKDYLKENGNYQLTNLKETNFKPINL